MKFISPRQFDVRRSRTEPRVLAAFSTEIFRCIRHSAVGGAQTSAPVIQQHRDSFATFLLTADIVAKVFSGWRTKILRAADALYPRRRGPYRFIQNRSRTSVVALKSDAAAEKSKIDFREIFRVVRFSTFATISAKSRYPAAVLGPQLRFLRGCVTASRTTQC